MTVEIVTPGVATVDAVVPVVVVDAVAVLVLPPNVVELAATVTLAPMLMPCAAFTTARGRVCVTSNASR